MKRLTLTLAAALLAGAATSALAGQVEDSIVRQLRTQGYSDISVTRTLLGRSRITASTATSEREIIVNPRTGEILRDYRKTTSGGEPLLFNPKAGSDDDGDDRSGSNSGPGSGDDGDDGDNSGHGSDSSGSGSGGGDDGGGNSGPGGGENSGSDGGDD